MLGNRTRWLARIVALGAIGVGASASGRVLGNPAPLTVTWRQATQSPRLNAADAAVASLQAACGSSDAALAEVAGRTANRQAGGGALLGADELAFPLRASGDPHVWPR